MFQKFHGFQIFIASVNIGNPLAVPFAIVQIEHGSDCVDTDTVRMVLFDPEQCIGNQVVGNFRPAVIINQCPPVRVGTLSGIQMLIQTGA